MARRKAKPISAVEIDTGTEEVRPAETFQVELMGGPLAHNAKLLVDGKQLKKVTKVVVIADVNDVFRFQTEQIAAEADVKITAGSWERNLLAKVTVYDDEDNPTAYLGRGQTVREALESVLVQIEAKEPKVH